VAECVLAGSTGEQRPRAGEGNEEDSVGLGWLARDRSLGAVGEEEGGGPGVGATCEEDAWGRNSMGGGTWRGGGEFGVDAGWYEVGGRCRGVCAPDPRWIGVTGARSCAGGDGGACGVAV
jgi:hypothetical protein